MGSLRRREKNTSSGFWRTKTHSVVFQKGLGIEIKWALWQIMKQVWNIIKKDEDFRVNLLFFVNELFHQYVTWTSKG